MSIIRSAAALVLLALPTLAGAQWGANVGIRSQSGDGEGSNSERRGVEGRVIYDLPLRGVFALRADAGYNQMQYQRDLGLRKIKISENGFEVGLAARGEIRRGALTGTFGSVGPVASFRARCGTAGQNDPNGRAACDEGETYLTGYQATAGYRFPASERNDFTAELRVLGNVTAAQGGQLVSLTFGLRRGGARPRRD